MKGLNGKTPMRIAPRRWLETLLLSLAALLIAQGAWAQCQSFSDVVQTEQAALGLAANASEAERSAARERLSRRLDLLAALYPDAEEGDGSVMGAYIASRRTLLLLHDNFGPTAAREFVGAPGFNSTLDILTGPEGEAACETSARAPGAAEGEDDAAAGGGFGPRTQRAGGQPLQPIGRIQVNFDNIETIGPMTFFGGLTLVAMLILASFIFRKERRYACFEPVRMRISGAEVEGVAVNISRSGAKLRSDVSVRRGQGVRIRLAGAVYPATVRWARDGLFGVEFGEKMRVGDFSRFLRRAEEGAGMAEMEWRPPEETDEPDRSPGVTGKAAAQGIV